MKRPYIFCHMMTSLDGKIMGTYMDTPEGTAAGEMFYDIAFGKDTFYKHEGWISGRVTTDDNFTFYEKPDLDEDAPEVSVGDFIVTAERPMYYVSIDRSGRRPLGEVSGNECQRIGHGKEKMKYMIAGLAAVTFLSAGTFSMEASAMADSKHAAVKITQTAGRQQLGDFAPDFAHYNDDILFGEAWSKNDVLPLRERSIVTVSALVAGGITDSSLKYHIESAKKNGVTREEMAEVITQLGFYAEWPKAWAAFNMAKDVYNDDPAENTPSKESSNVDLGKH